MPNPEPNDLDELLIAMQTKLDDLETKLDQATQVNATQALSITTLQDRIRNATLAPVERGRNNQEVPLDNLEEDDFRVPAKPVPPVPIKPDDSDSPYLTKLHNLETQAHNTLARRRDTRHQLIALDMVDNRNIIQQRCVQRLERDIDIMDADLALIDLQIKDVQHVKSAISGCLESPPTVYTGERVDLFGNDTLLQSIHYTKKLTDQEDRLQKQWEHILIFAKQQHWTEAEIKAALSVALVGDHLQTYNANATKPLRDILKILSKRFLTKNAFTLAKDKLKNFTRNPDESLQTAMTRFMEIFDKVAPIYTEEERPHRKRFHMESILRQITTKKAVEAIERKLLESRQQGTTIGIRQLVKLADIEESISGRPDEISTSVTLHNVQTTTTDPPISAVLASIADLKQNTAQQIAEINAAISKVDRRPRSRSASNHDRLRQIRHPRSSLPATSPNRSHSPLRHVTPQNYDSPAIKNNSSPVAQNKYDQRKPSNSFAKPTTYYPRYDEPMDESDYHVNSQNRSYSSNNYSNRGRSRDRYPRAGSSSDRPRYNYDDRNRNYNRSSSRPRSQSAQRYQDRPQSSYNDRYSDRNRQNNGYRNDRQRSTSRPRSAGRYSRQNSQSRNGQRQWDNQRQDSSSYVCPHCNCRVKHSQDACQIQKVIANLKIQVEPQVLEQAINDVIPSEN